MAEKSVAGKQRWLPKLRRSLRQDGLEQNPTKAPSEAEVPSPTRPIRSEELLGKARQGREGPRNQEVTSASGGEEKEKRGGRPVCASADEDGLSEINQTRFVFV